LVDSSRTSILEEGAYPRNTAVACLTSITNVSTYTIRILQSCKRTVYVVASVL